MAMNGRMDEKFHVEMQKEGFFDGIYDNIEDIDIFDFSGNRNVLLEELGSCFDGEALPVTALTSSSGDGGSRLTEEENQLCDDLNFPEDWLNNLPDDTNFNLDLPAISTIVIPENDYITKDDTLFRSTSPVSVIEGSNLNGSGVGSSSSSTSRSSSSSTSSNSITNVTPPRHPIPSIPSRARTKRSRPAGFPPRVNLSVDVLPVLPSKLDDVDDVDNLESFSLPMKKKKKKWPSFVSVDINDDGVAVRKCVHCGIQKTPQWRTGPMGPKTLCNACGVRYKSGRLFPEYRPAASPTFVPSVHSNSHKKVVEMRIKACQEDTNSKSKAVSPALKNCDLVAYIRG